MWVFLSRNRRFAGADRALNGAWLGAAASAMASFSWSHAPLINLNNGFQLHSAEPFVRRLTVAGCNQCHMAARRAARSEALVAALSRPSKLSARLDHERMLMSAVACCGIVCRTGRLGKRDDPLRASWPRLGEWATQRGNFVIASRKTRPP